MTIIDKIIASIQAVHGSSFPVYYHDELTLNVMADRMTFPCAYVQLITQGNVVNQSGQLREAVTAAVFFVNLSEFDFDAIANEVIIDECKQRAFQWLDAMPLDEWLTLEGVETTSRVYQQFDAIVTGFAARVRLSEIVGWTNCPEVEGVDFNDDFNEDFY